MTMAGYVIHQPVVMLESDSCNWWLKLDQAAANGQNIAAVIVIKLSKTRQHRNDRRISEL